MKRGILVLILGAMGIFLLAGWGRGAVKTMAEGKYGSHCIIVDPGHGGVDGGATSCTGVLESRINLEIAMRLNDLLHLLGFRTKMIRTTDISVYTSGNSIAQIKISDLRERVRIVNETPNAVLISIHQNTFPDGRYRGGQVFYAGTEGSRELAAALQEEWTRVANPGGSRKSKKSSGIYLMEHIRCPAILVECGFLSNLEEEAKLRDPEYQKGISAIMASTLSRFLTDT